MIESQVQETPESVASHYDELDAFYREVWGLHVHHGFWRKGDKSRIEATHALIDELVSDLDMSAVQNVCDIGCGYGETARYLARRFPVHVTGLSVSREQLSFAAKLAPHPSVKLLYQDWMRNNLPSDSFDFAYSIESSEHMPDLRTFFTEAFRVLKPGGSFKVCAWLSQDNPGSKDLKYFLQPICTEGRMHLGDAREYETIMREVGFEDIQFRDISREVKKTWTLCLRNFSWKLLSDPKYLRFFLKDPSENKKFLLSLIRIRTAYERGSLRYGIFSARKPAANPEH